MTAKTFLEPLTKIFSAFTLQAMNTANTIICWKKHLTNSLPDPLCCLAFIELEPHYPTSETVSLLRHTIGGTVVESNDITPVKPQKLWQIIKPHHLVYADKAKNFVRSIPKNMLEDMIKNWKAHKQQNDPYIDSDIRAIEAVLNP